MPLAKMTLAQKLDLIKPLWDNVCKNYKPAESSAWHEAVLQDRQIALEAGKASVHDWQEAKQRITRRASQTR